MEKIKIPSLLATAALAVLGLMFLTSNADAQTCRRARPADFCDRDCWNARNPGSCISYMSNLNRAVIHHTAAASDYNTSGLSDSKANVRGVQNYHMDVNGWCDIGYHFLVDKHGNWFTGRKDSYNSFPQGAHDGCNSSSFGFTALGYFHTPYNHTVTDALYNKLRNVIAWRMPTGWDATGGGSTYCSGVTDKVIGHRKVSATACPGDKLEAKTGDGSGFETDINQERACN
jgi:hypothetical protein